MPYLLEKIHRSIQRIGDIFCYIIIVTMALIAIDVVSRYVFAKPTLWSGNFNTEIYGLYVLIAGFYAMSKNTHIKIEMLYIHFPPWLKTVAQWIGLLCFVSYMGCLVWQSSWYGYTSFSLKEAKVGGFPMPTYPLKMLMTVTSILFLIEGIVVFILYRDKKVEN